MMPIGVPRVPYRSQKEGSWQWVDIWNCLVSPFLPGCSLGLASCVLSPWVHLYLKSCPDLQGCMPASAASPVRTVITLT
jgi:hypothetical protein